MFLFVEKKRQNFQLRNNNSEMFPLCAVFVTILLLVHRNKCTHYIYTVYLQTYSICTFFETFSKVSETEISFHIFFYVELHAGIGPGAGVDWLSGLRNLHHWHSQHVLQQAADWTQTWSDWTHRGHQRSAQQVETWLYLVQVSESTCINGRDAAL